MVQCLWLHAALAPLFGAFSWQVFHPNFVRASEAAGAYAKLKAGEAGRFYFRPKTSAKDELELVWAFQAGGCCKHFAVKESDRANPQVGPLVCFSSLNFTEGSN